MTLLDPAPADRLARLRRPKVDLEVVVPCRNEARRLPRTLARTVEYLAEQSYSSAVVVVDNGSVDRTPALVDSFQDAPVPVHRLGCAQAGKGAAVRRGVLTSSARWVGYMDADLATPVETLDGVVPLLREGAAAVCASRYADGARFAADQPPHRRLGSAAFRKVASQVVPDVRDTQCGFKFFDGVLARDIAAELRTPGFAFDVELLARCRRQGAAVMEIPVCWRDMPGSRFSPARHTFGIVLELGRIWLRLRARPRPAARPAWEPPLDPVGYP